MADRSGAFCLPMLTSSIVSLLAVVLLPLLAQRRWGTFGASVATVALFGVVAGATWLAVELDWLDALRIVSASAERAYHDTYYVIHQGWATFGRTALLAMVTLALGLERVFGRLGRRWIAGVFWIWYLAVIATIWGYSVLFALGTPRRYIDYPDAFSLYFQISEIFSTIAFLALACLGLLILLSLALRLKST